MRMVLKYLTSTPVRSEININYSHSSVLNNWNPVFQWSIKSSSDSSPEFSGIIIKETHVWPEQHIHKSETPVSSFSFQPLPLLNLYLCNNSLISTIVGACSQTYLSNVPKSLAPCSPTFQDILFVLLEGGELLSTWSRSSFSLRFSFCNSLMFLDNLRTAAFSAFSRFWVSLPSVLGNRVKTTKLT